MTLSELAQELPALRDEAKHMWGEEKADYYVEYVSGENAQWLEDYLDGAWVSTNQWQYHLQQMLISDNPSKYLRENTK